jgi:DedD protein
MPPDLHSDQELTLKKRARRRLVGAIALVLLMVIILPRILQDRASLVPQEAIKITMPEAKGDKPVEAVQANVTPVEPKVDLTAADESIIAETPVASAIGNEAKLDRDNKISAIKNDHENKKVENIAADAEKADVKTVVTKKNEVKISESKLAEQKPKENKVVDTKSPQKNDGNFTIQVGVFSDISNVKQLQAKLKQAGFTSHTEKITTPKGEKIRLRAGSFNSRQDATYALTKLHASDLSGMVISND